MNLYYVKNTGVNYLQPNKKYYLRCFGYDWNGDDIECTKYIYHCPLNICYEYVSFNTITDPINLSLKMFCQYVKGLIAMKI